MGVYIKGMEMPKSCSVCWALDDDGDYPRCRITEEQRGYNFRIREKRMDKCPLAPVPPHGRLIDADANIAVMMRVLYAPYTGHGTIDTAMLKACIKMFEEAPAIIPASEEGEP